RLKQTRGPLRKTIAFAVSFPFRNASASAGPPASEAAFPIRNAATSPLHPEGPSANWRRSPEGPRRAMTRQKRNRHPLPAPPAAGEPPSIAAPRQAPRRARAYSATRPSPHSVPIIRTSPGHYAKNSAPSRRKTPDASEGLFAQKKETVVPAASK